MVEPYPQLIQLVKRFRNARATHDEAKETAACVVLFAHLELIEEGEGQNLGAGLERLTYRENEASAMLGYTAATFCQWRRNEVFKPEVHYWPAPQEGALYTKLNLENIIRLGMERSKHQPEMKRTA